ncbi:hypothetical protein NP493_476g02042 [Ridgeia piscesae]|uniref:Seryl-tRNA synthetase n=1 Tax=Ridgeia piscesae TaxID=27915 RepID=A0AAD9KYJ8_RIDPI|nr:hypothetical protein NP493_476g02042 [Ridgeia piscesae]
MLKALASICHCHARGSETLCQHSAQIIVAMAGSTRVIPFRGVDRMLSYSRSGSFVRSITLGADTTLNSQTLNRQQARCLASHVRSPAHSEPLSTPGSTHVSALYIDHLDPLNTTVVDVDLDLMKRLEDVTTLVDNVTSRGMYIDVHQLVRDAAKQNFHLEHVSMISLTDYHNLMSKQTEKKALETERERISQRMKTLVKQKQSSPEVEKEKETLKERGKEVRELLKVVTRAYYDIEKKVMLVALQLPVDLHPHTPVEDMVVRESNEIPEFSFPVKDHVTIGRNSHILKMGVISRGSFYLCGPLAHLELHLMELVSQRLRDAGLQQFSCPDMFKTVVMVFNMQPKATSEGENEESLSLDRLSNVLYLAGVSPMSFAAYLTRMTVAQSSLPLRCFTQGRRYSPKCFDPSFDVGLLGAQQTNAVRMMLSYNSLVNSDS